MAARKIKIRSFGRNLACKLKIDWQAEKITIKPTKNSPTHLTAIVKPKKIPKITALLVLGFWRYCQRKIVVAKIKVETKISSIAVLEWINHKKSKLKRIAAQIASR